MCLTNLCAYFAVQNNKRECTNVSCVLFLVQHSKQPTLRPNRTCIASEDANRQVIGKQIPRGRSGIINLIGKPMHKTDDHKLNQPIMGQHKVDQHIIGQRIIDEGQSKLHEVLIKLANKMSFYEACSRADCRRAKTCKAAKRQKSGAKKGLITKRPICATLFKEELREIAKLMK